MDEISLFWKMFSTKRAMQFLLNFRKKKNKKKLYPLELKWVCYKSK